MQILRQLPRREATDVGLTHFDQLMALASFRCSLVLIFSWKAGGAYGGGACEVISSRL